jgi:HAD superfamily hydrolase (TIGR01509 family)
MSWPEEMEAVYQAVLFDMDGVLVSTERSVVAFWASLAESRGLALDGGDVAAHVLGCSAEHTLRELFPQIPARDHHAVYDRLRDYETGLTYEPVAGAVDLVRSLAAADIPMALVTGAQRWKAATVLHQLGIVEEFVAIVSAEDVVAGKPDPACYRLGADLLGTQARHCVAFEDSVSGARSVVAAGAACVGIDAAGTGTALLRAGALEVVPDLAAVTVSTAPLRLSMRGLSLPLGALVPATGGRS